MEVGLQSLTGGSGADFHLSSGKQPITDFNPAEGDQFLIQSESQTHSRKKDVICLGNGAILKNMTAKVLAISR